MVIPVDLGTRSYSIVVEPGALATVGTRLRELRVGSRAVLMTDAGILKVHGRTVVAGLEAAGLSVTVREVPDGEAAKTLGWARRSFRPCPPARPVRASPRSSVAAACWLPPTSTTSSARRRLSLRATSPP